MKQVTVISEYRAAYSEPLQLSKGDEIKVGKTDTEWPGWYWCTDSRGNSAWVHKEFLSQIKNGAAITSQDYDSTELSVSTGEKLEIDCELGGWLWGVTCNGTRGWIPAKNTDWHE